MSAPAISGSVVWLTLAFAAGIANGCATAKRSAASPENPPMVVKSTDDEPMQPASASLPLTRREAPPETTTIGNPDESPSTSNAKLESTSEVSSADAPKCSMHAENTPRGIALIFSTRTSAPERVAAQVRALAAELEADRGTVNGTRTADPSSFGTRQIAELAAQSFVTETPEGGRLTIDAKEPGAVDALRARVLWNMAGFLPDSRDKRSECPIVPRVAAEQRERERDIENASAAK